MLKSAFLSSGANDAQRGHSALLPFYAGSSSSAEVTLRMQVAPLVPALLITREPVNTGLPHFSRTTVVTLLGTNKMAAVQASVLCKPR